jgi:hypothetical protein
MKPHKWAKEIKAWADGAEIESRFKDKVTGWTEWDCMGEILAFSEDDWWEFRIKPQPKEPQYFYVYKGKFSEHIALSEIERDDKDYNYIGKIKLETDDGN